MNLSVWVRIGGLCLLMLGCLPGEPPATVSEVNQAQKKIDSLNKRVGMAEQAVSQWAKAVDDTEKMSRQLKADQSVLMEDLRSEFKSLKGSLEETQYDLKQFRESQKKYQDDLEFRLKELENRSQTSPTRTEAPGPTGKKGKTATIQDDSKRYEHALRLVLDQQNYDQAILEFSSFLDDRPNISLSPNAQYWLAEAYFKKGDYPTAVTEYQKLIDQFPKSDKFCDAIYKQGLSFFELKDAEKSKLFFSDVKDRCPKSNSASKAQKKLTELAKLKAKQ